MQNETLKKLLHMTDRQYDGCKFVAQIVLPAIATFYFTIASIWGLPYSEQIVGTITAIDTLLGALLMISSSVHNDSTMDK